MNHTVALPGSMIWMGIRLSSGSRPQSPKGPSTALTQSVFCSYGPVVVEWRGMLCAWSSQYPHRPIPPDQSRSVGDLAHTQSGFSDESQETRLEIEISSNDFWPSFHDWFARPVSFAGRTTTVQASVRHSKKITMRTGERPLDRAPAPSARRPDRATSSGNRNDPYALTPTSPAL